MVTGFVCPCWGCNNLNYIVRLVDYPGLFGYPNG